MQPGTTVMNVNVEARTVKLVRVQSMRELMSEKGQERERGDDFIMAIVLLYSCTDLSLAAQCMVSLVFLVEI